MVVFEANLLEPGVIWTDESDDKAKLLIAQNVHFASPQHELVLEFSNDFNAKIGAEENFTPTNWQICFDFGGPSFPRYKQNFHI